MKLEGDSNHWSDKKSSWQVDIDHNSQTSGHVINSHYGKPGENTGLHWFNLS